MVGESSTTAGETANTSRKIARAVELYWRTAMDMRVRVCNYKSKKVCTAAAQGRRFPDVSIGRVSKVTDGPEPTGSLPRLTSTAVNWQLCFMTRFSVPESGVVSILFYV